MISVFLLRASSVVCGLFALGHMAGGLKQWSPMGSNPVLDAMGATKFQTMGVTRTYLDFFLGFGWTVGAFLLFQAFLLWKISDMSVDGSAAVRPLVLANAVLFAIVAAIAFRFIFPVPAIFSAALALALLAAFFL
jgi:hypothetical protein